MNQSVRTNIPSSFSADPYLGVRAESTEVGESKSSILRMLKSRNLYLFHVRLFQNVEAWNLENRTDIENFVFINMEGDPVFLSRIL